MIAAEINIKPLSVNEAYISAHVANARKIKALMQAKQYNAAFKIVNIMANSRKDRIKTSKYLSYETELLWRLPAGKINKDRLLGIYVDFIFATSASDIDNPLKPFLDVLQKKYGFDDNKFCVMSPQKYVAGHGKYGIKFRIEEFPEGFKFKKHPDEGVYTFQDSVNCPNCATEINLQK